MGIPAVRVSGPPPRTVIRAFIFVFYIMKSPTFPEITVPSLGLFTPVEQIDEAVALRAASLQNEAELYLFRCGIESAPEFAKVVERLAQLQRRFDTACQAEDKARRRARNAGWHAAQVAATHKGQGKTRAARKASRMAARAAAAFADARLKHWREKRSLSDLWAYVLRRDSDRFGSLKSFYMAALELAWHRSQA